MGIPAGWLPGEALVTSPGAGDAGRPSALVHRFQREASAVAPAMTGGRVPGPASPGVPLSASGGLPGNAAHAAGVLNGLNEMDCDGLADVAAELRWACSPAGNGRRPSS